MSIAVIVLNYNRKANVENRILPSLLKEKCVSTIIVAHGAKQNVFGVPDLQDGEIKMIDKVWHVGDFSNNDQYRCFRRWELIYNLQKKDLLKEEYIFSQDDDLVFKNGEIAKLLNHTSKGKLLSGVFGRNISNNTYNVKNFKGAVDIVIGRSILGKVSDIVVAVQQIKDLNIPTDSMMEDDITLCFFILDNYQIDSKQHFSLPLQHNELPAPGAVSLRKNHLERRNRTLSYLMNLKTAKIANT